MNGIESILLFLEKFVCKIVEKKGSKGTEILKFYQCPKCYQKGKSEMIQQPVNFLGHLLGQCDDWYDFVTKEDKILFVGAKGNLNKTLKSFLNELMISVSAR